MHGIGIKLIRKVTNTLQRINHLNPNGTCFRGTNSTNKKLYILAFMCSYDGHNEQRLLP